MTSSLVPFLRHGIWTFILLTPFALVAQDDSPPAADDAPAEEEVFELSPFEIFAQDDQGWDASTTLVGSRTRQEIRDLSISVDALTADFLEDMGVETLQEAGYFIAGLDSVDEHERDTDDNRTSFRGLELGGRENAQSSRNFFSWYPRTDTYNVERIDFNKGSNSLMFGDASPGGLATVYTKRAMSNNFGVVAFTYDSFDSYRFTLDVNRKITEQLFLRFNMVDRNKKSYLNFAEDELQGYHFALTYRPLKNTVFRAEYEKLDFARNRANSRLAINQRAALGLGFSRSDDHYYTSDGDYIHGDARDIYLADGSGGFLDPIDLERDDRRQGGGGDDLSLARNLTATVLDRRTNEPFLTIGPIPRDINVKGTRDFIIRPVENYSFWLEQGFGDLVIELAYNRQEQTQNRNDSSFSTLSVDANGRIYEDASVDRKAFGNEVNVIRLTAAMPWELSFTRQFLVANVTYQDDLASSFRFKLVNKAAAFDAVTGTYDVTRDLEARDEIRVRGYFEQETLVQDLRNPAIFDSLRPENLPNVPGIFEPLWVAETDSVQPFFDKRFTRTASISTSGTYFDGKLRSLFGIRYDEFALKSYVVPEGTSQELVDQFGELAWWGQDVFLGDPDQAPDQYAYDPELNQDAVTYSVGLSYSLTDEWNIYLNNSTSFRWQGVVDFLGRNLGPQEGDTREFGIKAELFENKVTVGAAVYQVKRENVSFRIDTENNTNELELLFNDVDVQVVGGEIIYTAATNADPGFVDIAGGNSRAWETITSSEEVNGFELTVSMKRTKGLRARLALTYLDAQASVDIGEYAAFTALATERAAARAAIIDEFWNSDPNFVPGTLPEFEDDLREYLEDAQQVVANNTGGSIITSSRARPWGVSWILDYRFPRDFFLSRLRATVSGKWSDDYILSLQDGVEWEGGATHPVNVMLSYAMDIFDLETTFRLSFRSIVDLENRDGIKLNGGFVDQFTGEEVPTFRNISPMRTDFSVTVKF